VEKLIGKRGPRAAQERDVLSAVPVLNVVMIRPPRASSNSCLLSVWPVPRGWNEVASVIHAAAENLPLVISSDNGIQEVLGATARVMGLDGNVKLVDAGDGSFLQALSCDSNSSSHSVLNSGSAHTNGRTFPVWSSRIVIQSRLGNFRLLSSSLIHHLHYHLSAVHPRYHVQKHL